MCRSQPRKPGEKGVRETGRCTVSTTKFQLVALPRSLLLHFGVCPVRYIVYKYLDYSSLHAVDPESGKKTPETRRYDVAHKQEQYNTTMLLNSPIFLQHTS